jgi:hypothetical protein
VKKKSVVFECQLTSSEIRNLAKEYIHKNGDDGKALSAGAAIREGNYSREKLMTIAEWKLERENGTYHPSIAYISENTDEEIAEAFEIAVRARTARVGLGVLTTLRGIEVKVASAIMTAIYPDRYTVIDVRSLEELGQKQDSPSIDYYLQYRDACEEIAAERGVSLRDLDRALWQKNKNRNLEERGCVAV